MIDAANPTNNFSLDVQGIGNLRLQAKTDPEAALKASAQQFEAVFMQMMLKSMRDTVGQDGVFDSEETRQYTSMLDQQLSQSLAGKGLGLADIIAKQLKAQTAPVQQANIGAAPAATSSTAIGTTSAPRSTSSATEFVNKLWPHAAAASQATGIPARFMIGHAALESGWGKAEIRGPDGQTSHNLFGIKAGRGWTGQVVEATTTEYVNGVAQKSIEKFRAYPSYAAAFNDYAHLLKNNPRYASVVGSSNDPAAFAASLQQAGYATDPVYAEKLTRILQGSTLRQSLLG